MLFSGATGVLLGGFAAFRGGYRGKAFVTQVCSARICCFFHFGSVSKIHITWINDDYDDISRWARLRLNRADLSEFSCLSPRVSDARWVIIFCLPYFLFWFLISIMGRCYCSQKQIELRILEFRWRPHSLPYLFLLSDVTGSDSSAR